MKMLLGALAVVALGCFEAAIWLAEKPISTKLALQGVVLLMLAVLCILVIVDES